MATHDSAAEHRSAEHGSAEHGHDAQVVVVAAPHTRAALLDDLRTALADQPAGTTEERIGQLESYLQHVLTARLGDTGAVQPLAAGPHLAGQHHFRAAQEIQGILAEARAHHQSAMKMDPCKASLYTGLAAITAGALMGPAGAIGGFIVACAGTYTACA